MCFIPLPFREGGRGRGKLKLPHPSPPLKGEGMHFLECSQKEHEKFKLTCKKVGLKKLYKY